MGHVIKEHIQNNLWYIGIADENLKHLRRHAVTDVGVTYSSYLLDTGEGYLLIGTPPVKYANEWLQTIIELIGNGKMKWSVVFGEEADRTAIQLLLGEYPDIIIIAGTNPLFKLRRFIYREFNSIEIRSERRLHLGKHSFHFHVLQDKMETASVYVVDATDCALYTADAFGAFCAADKGTLSGMGHCTASFYRGIRQYYTDILGEKRSRVIDKGIDLVRENGVRMICPAYGPVWDKDIDHILHNYTSSAEASAGNKLTIISAGDGYTREIADQIEEGARETGDIELTRVNLNEISREEAFNILRNVDFYLFGSSENSGDVAKSLWDIVTMLNKNDVKGKYSAYFGNGELSCKFADSFIQRLSWLGFDLSTAKCIIQGQPSEDELKNAYEYGFDLSCIIKHVPNPRKPKLVKCLVCGEIFDASLGICPVCGVGLDQCVPANGDESTFRKDSDKKYIILGGGVAAVAAAEAIRRRDADGIIEMFSAETYLPINRPMLTKDFRTIAEDPKSLSIHEQKWFDEMKINIHLATMAISLDIPKKKVTVVKLDAVGKEIKESESDYTYDKLIYATGAECFVPPFEGHNKAGVITIRHLQDLQELERRMKTAKNVVVIGGGVLGLEAASELMKQGMKVTVLEAAPQIIGRQVDAVSAAILKKKMEAMHVECYEGVSIKTVESEVINKKEHITGVRISDERIFPADFVIVSCGNKGNIQVAQTAGIKHDRSIIVDSHMETNVKDIYACGDCAQYQGINFQLWQEASDQGKIAGANAAGENIIYMTQMLGLSLEGFGTSLYALGDPGKDEKIRYRTVEIGDAVSNSNESYWFFGHSLQGAVVIGKPDKTANINTWVSTHARYEEIF